MPQETDDDHVRRYGDGPPIVLAGGAFQDRAFGPPTAGLPKLPGAGVEVFHP